MKTKPGDWNRKTIANELSIRAALEEIANGFRGPMSDSDMERLAKCQRIVYGPAPEPSWDTHEVNT